MTQTGQRPMTWSDLGRNRTGWVVSGIFAVDGSSYVATLASQRELARFVDFALASTIKPATTRLYLHPDEVPTPPEHQVSNLRFQFDPEHRVAAAVLLAIPRGSGVLSWQTLGDAGRGDVVLAHDSWNEHETLFPVESFITIDQLRAVVTEWAFGELLPPPAVSWAEVDGIGWF